MAKSGITCMIDAAFLQIEEVASRIAGLLLEKRIAERGEKVCGLETHVDLDGACLFCRAAV